MQRKLAMNTQGLLMDISAYRCILKQCSNVVAQLTKMYSPVGCRPVRLSPSRLSPCWFVAQMTVHRTVGLNPLVDVHFLTYLALVLVYVGICPASWAQICIQH